MKIAEALDPRRATLVANAWRQFENQILPAILKVIDEEKPDRVVIGVPFNMNGSKGPMAEKVEKFVETLKGSTRVPIS